MPKQQQPTSHKRALIGALVIALAVGAYLLWQFVAIIVAAAIAAFVFYPVFMWLKKKTKRTGAAASLTLLASIVAVLIPFTVVILVTVAQVQVFVKDVDTAISTGDSLLNSDNALEEINNFLGQISGDRISLTIEQIQSYALKAASAVGEVALNFLKGSVGSAAALITSAIIYIYVFSALLVHKDKLIKLAKQLNPLGDEIADMYLQRAGAMTKGMIRGQFIIAALQGLAGAVFLYIAGVHYFAFFALVLTIFSIIPLGGGIISIPLGIVMLLTGNVVGGLFVILTHVFLVTNIDNVLRPMLVPKQARLNPALTIMSVIGGIALFGFIGLVVGPVLMILVVSTIEVYTKFIERESAHET